MISRSRRSISSCTSAGRALHFSRRVAFHACGGLNFGEVASAEGTEGGGAAPSALALLGSGAAVSAAVALSSPGLLGSLMLVFGAKRPLSSRARSAAVEVVSTLTGGAVSVFTVSAGAGVAVCSAAWTWAS